MSENSIRLFKVCNKFPTNPLTFNFVNSIDVGRIEEDEKKRTGNKTQLQLVFSFNFVMVICGSSQPASHVSQSIIALYFILEMLEILMPTRHTHTRVCQWNQWGIVSLSYIYFFFVRSFFFAKCNLGIFIIFWCVHFYMSLFFHHRCLLRLSLLFTPVSHVIWLMQTRELLFFRVRI